MIKEKYHFHPSISRFGGRCIPTILLQQNLPIQEQSITPEILIEAEEIFLTNAIREL